ncbi:SDR family NAD(P)-dependent oxidoreductase [uncultured Aurantimicrobium sp.]|uniref:SDR family NAD(P)-dependent oxidoreductase n=1 Tax=uncultured Aurantimicrobium sp. TaxID=1705357 RepID=UPI00263700C8|nr:glucose 1-dehydrogenase [uncultured Aurantimicrobium sp.]
MGTMLANKIALVTGGGSGIGKATCLAIAAEGARVVVNDLDLSSAQAVVQQIIDNGGTASAVSGNVSVPEDVEALVAAVQESYGGLHLAVNNAGIGGPLGPLADVEIEGYKRVIAVNQDSVFYGMKYQIPAMIASGGGSIVNMSSILGLVGDGFVAPYVAAKHAVTGLTKSAALAYASNGIRVNSIHPGYTETPLLSELPQEAYDGLVSAHPIGRLGQPEEIADLIVFLLSDKAAFITGSQHVIDGGYTAR